MSTTLEPSFLQAVVMMTGFKPNVMKSAQAALLLIGLRRDRFTANEIPPEITNGNKHVAGAATGALISTGLLEVVGRVKSPDVRAKGRKLDLLHVPAERTGSVKAWLRANGYQEEVPVQLEIPV